MLQDYLTQIKTLAAQKGVSMDAAIKAAGLARTTIWRAETGRAALSQQVAEKLAEAIDRLASERAA